MFTVIHFDADAAFFEFSEDLIHRRHNLLFLGIFAINRDNHNLGWGNFRGHFHTLIVAVNHNQRANHACRHTPRSGVGEFKFVVFVEEINFESGGEILPKIMGCAALQGFGIAHHGFDASGHLRTSETLGIRFIALHNGDRAIIFGEIGVNIKHSIGFFFRFFGGGVRGVTLLPVKFGGAEKEFGTQLPAHNAAPLVD